MRFWSACGRDARIVAAPAQSDAQLQVRVHVALNNTLARAVTPTSISTGYHHKHRFPHRVTGVCRRSSGRFGMRQRCMLRWRPSTTRTRSSSRCCSCTARPTTTPVRAPPCDRKLFGCFPCLHIVACADVALLCLALSPARQVVRPRAVSSEATVCCAYQNSSVTVTWNRGLLPANACTGAGSCVSCEAALACLLSSPLVSSA